jgi:glycine cleavage system H protein
MPDAMTFMMGKFAAELPGDLLYTRYNHMWCRPAADGRLRFGFTAYAVRLMQDVYFLDWCVDAGAAVQLKQHVGNIETSKAQSDLFAPAAGTVAAFNGELLKDPSGINVDCYAAWLFEMDADPAGMMDVRAYHDFLAAGWENTQRMLKGQM